MARANIRNHQSNILIFQAHPPADEKSASARILLLRREDPTEANFLE